VLPVIQTPLRSDGGLDLETLRQEIAWVLRQGASGVTVGMVSEITRLSTDERRVLSRTVCEEAKRHGATAIIACGAESTRSAVELAQHAAEHGADAVMATPPLTVALDDDALFEYFTEIAGGAGVPLVVQDASGYIGPPLSIDLQARLLDALGEAAYFKPEAPPIGARLSRLRDATGGKARIFEGSGGAALVDSFRRGVVGSMPGAEVCWAVQALWDALVRGDWDTAYQISMPLTSLTSLQSGLDGYIAVEKYLLVRQGVFASSAARGPHSFVLDPETTSEVDLLFDRLRAAVLAGPAEVGE
jgi:4-hydroxy-tetrahydrodipicolinate synthase